MWSDDGEKGGAYFGVLAQAFLGKLSCWDDIPPKKCKHEPESLDAYYRDWQEKNPSLI